MPSYGKRIKLGISCFVTGTEGLFFPVAVTGNRRVWGLVTGPVTDTGFITGAVANSVIGFSSFLFVHGGVTPNFL